MVLLVLERVCVVVVWCGVCVPWWGRGEAGQYTIPLWYIRVLYIPASVLTLDLLALGVGETINTTATRKDPVVGETTCR